MLEQPKPPEPFVLADFKIKWCAERQAETDKFVSHFEAKIALAEKLAAFSVQPNHTVCRYGISIYLPDATRLPELRTAVGEPFVMAGKSAISASEVQVCLGLKDKPWFHVFYKTPVDPEDKCKIVASAAVSYDLVCPVSNDPA